MKKRTDIPRKFAKYESQKKPQKTKPKPKLKPHTENLSPIDNQS